MASGKKASFVFKIDGIGHLISDRFFSVPIYQRSYSWDADNIDAYWNDINNAIDDGKGEYFLGTIVLTDSGEEGLSNVIDGQQRLSTTIILFSAIQRFLDASGDKKDASHIRDRYVAASTFGSDDDRPKIRMNTDDDPFFRYTVIEHNATKFSERKPSHELIRQTFEYFYKQLENIKENDSAGWRKRLEKFVNFLNLSVQVVVVDVPDEADAFLIFETLNDRGADLTTADLLKNYLFGRAGKDLDAVRDRWVAAVSALETVADNRVFTTFLRHIWSSMYGITRDRELYAAIKRRITTREQAVEFAERLSVEARNYAAILTPSHERWDELGSVSKENVQTLSRLELEQIRPLLLALVQYFSEGELKKALQYLVSWNLRSLLSGSAGGGSYEKGYCQASVRVRNGTIKTTGELFSELSSLIPTDLTFESNFRGFSVTKARIARYILHSLERYVSGTNNPELISNADEEQVNLEHILPKNAKIADWPSFDDDTKKEYVHRLGNMVLLSAKANKRIGNKPWSAKRPILSASELRLAKDAGANADWTVAAIEERQAKMASDAVKVWKRQPS